MLNSSAFELRRRAQRWFNHKEAQETMDEMFQFLLTRIIRHYDETLQIVVETIDPDFRDPDCHVKDRVILIDKKDSSNRMGVRAQRLRPNVLLAVYAICHKTVRPGKGGFGGFVETASKEELAELRHQAKSLINGKKLMDVFVKHDRPASRPQPAIAYGQPVA